MQPIKQDREDLINEPFGPGSTIPTKKKTKTASKPELLHSIDRSDAHRSFAHLVTKLYFTGTVISMVEAEPYDTPITSKAGASLVPILMLPPSFRLLDLGLHLLMPPPPQLLLMAPSPQHNLPSPKFAPLLLPPPSPLVVAPTGPVPNEPPVHQPNTESGLLAKIKDFNKSALKVPVEEAPRTAKNAQKVRVPKACAKPRLVRPQKWKIITDILGDSAAIAYRILVKKYNDQLNKCMNEDVPYPLLPNHVRIGPAELVSGEIKCKKTAERSLKKLIKVGFLKKISRKEVAEGESTIYFIVPLAEVAAAKLAAKLTHFVNVGNGGRRAVPAPDDDLPGAMNDPSEEV
jgi:hypothetical protein